MTITELEILLENKKRALSLSFRPEKLLNISDYWLCLRDSGIENLPESIGNLSFLSRLDISLNQLTDLPDSICSMTNLIELNISSNQLNNLPNSIGNLFNLIKLDLSDNQLKFLPVSLEKLVNLTDLDLSGNDINNWSEFTINSHNLTSLNLSNNKLVTIPKSFSSCTNLRTLTLYNNQLKYISQDLENFIDLVELDLSYNQISTLAKSLKIEKQTTLPQQLELGIEIEKLSDISSILTKLTNLEHLDLDENPLIDLSVLQNIHSLQTVNFLGVNLHYRYWTKFSDWKSEWLLDEDNAEIRRVLIEQVGYERICRDLSADNLDTWREYTLLKIDGVEAIYEDEDEPIDREPMVLLKMTCPSTAHIHILRVPPDMTSAEAAITWVNHGIHPDRFAVQT